MCVCDSATVSKDITFVNPYLYTNHTVREISLFTSEIDISTESLERNAAFLKFFCATHLGTSKTTRENDADAFNISVCHNLLDCLLHHTTECHALFKTFSKVVAQRRGLMATFMAKWSKDWPGQSGHIHMSLKNSAGAPVFHDPSKPHT